MYKCKQQLGRFVKKSTYLHTSCRKKSCEDDFGTWLEKKLHSHLKNITNHIEYFFSVHWTLKKPQIL